MTGIYQKIKNAYAFIGVTGIWHFLLSEIYRILTTPSFWERFLLRKIRGRRLAKSIQGLGDYTCDEIVSVVLPVNNGRSKGVERLVSSLKHQSHKNMEFIAVDSGSTDDTVSWLKSEGFNVIEIEPKSFTHAYSRNTGAAAAKGKYLLFVVDDVVFSDQNWLRSAIYLLERFEADSMSSHQSIDDNASVYARCLDGYLSTGQADRLTVNVSRSSIVTRLLHAILPLHSKFRSVAIDDTNHLVRREVFEGIRFHAPTVEDIDFAMRLAKVGGRILYTNLLTVLHYHEYTMDTLHKYARRVYVDSRVMAKWQRYSIRISSRETFLVAAFHALGVFIQAFKDLDKEMLALSGFRKKFNDEDTVSIEYIDAILTLTELLDSSTFRAMKYRNFACFEEARGIFLRVMGGEPPSDLYRIEAVAAYFIRRLRRDVSATKGMAFQNNWRLNDRNEIKTMIIFLWVNRVMSIMARPELFKSTEVYYPCDNWDIGAWA
jgi:glycosyltransferase involved in cell wall biosynthesis